MQEFVNSAEWVIFSGATWLKLALSSLEVTSKIKPNRKHMDDFLFNLILEIKFDGIEYDNIIFGIVLMHSGVIEAPVSYLEL